MTGLLHDIGRASQYQTGEHHAAAGARLAEEILEQVGYPEAWKQETVSAIRAHCGQTGAGRAHHGGVHQPGDHLSRAMLLLQGGARAVSGRRRRENRSLW